MKKFATLLLALGVALSSWAYDFSSDGIYYNITSSTNKTVEITYASTDTGCYLGSVTIPSSVTNGGTSYSVTAIGDGAFGHCKSLKSVTIPTTVTSIGYAVFFFCDSLTSVTIPNSVTTIEKYAFEDWLGATSISIPSSVTSIGDMAFFMCVNLKSIIVDDANTNFSSMDGVLFNKDKTKLIAYPEGKPEATYTVPSTVTAIGKQSFMYNDSLSGISFPSALASIGDSAFCSCSGLKTLSIPTTITSIGRYTFWGCERLKTVTIPNSVTTINGSGFDSCDSLSTVTIPASVTSIGETAFDCERLTNVYELNPTPSTITMSDKVFGYLDKSTCVLHVPAGSKSLYQVADQWKDFGSIVEDASAIYNVLASQVKISTNNGALVVSGLTKDTDLGIYTLQGAAIYSGKSSGDTQAIALPQRGVYIVRVGGQSVKVVY